MRGNHIQDPTRAVILATAAGTMVATATMILPVNLLFVTDGPSDAGIRALVAFGLGAMTLIGATSVWLGRGRNDQNLFEKFGEPIEDFAQSTERTRGHLAIKMPWHQSADAGSTQVSFNQLRPDNVDAADAAMIKPDDEPAGSSSDEMAVGLDVPHASEAPQPIYERSPEQPADASITDMIDQFETALAHRHKKLAELSESIFDNMPEAINLSSRTNANNSATPNIGEGRRPVLELVPAAPVTDDDADSALAAALATLERITVRAR